MTLRHRQLGLPSARGIGAPFVRLEAFGGDPDERLLADQFETLQTLVIRHQGDIDRAGVNLRAEFDRIFAIDRDLDQRVAAVERRENVGQKGLGVIVGNAQPHRAPEAFARKRGHRPGLDLHHATREFDQALALVRQLRRAALFDEQRAAELLLEPADMHGNSRLGLVDALAGAGERAGVDDGEKGAQLVGVEHGNRSDFVMDYSTNIRWTDQ